MKSMFNSEKSFFELPIVVWTGGIYIFLFLTLVFVISQNGEYEACGNAECFNFFVKQFSFPMGFLSTAIPVFAIYAAQHRSAQTLKQIKESERSNNFTIYMKHFEDFKEQIHPEYINKFVINERQLHKSLFTKIRNGQDYIQPETRELINSHVEKVYLAIKEIQSNKATYQNCNTFLRAEVIKSLKTLIFNLKSLAKCFSLNCIAFEEDIAKISEWLNKEDIDLDENLLESICDLISTFFTAFNSILQSCHEYVPNVCQREGFVKLEFTYSKGINEISFGLSDYGENGNTYVINLNRVEGSGLVFSPDIN